MADIFKTEDAYTDTSRSALAMAHIKIKDMGDGSHAEVIQTLGGGAATSDGSIINLDSLPQTLVYNADGTLNYTQTTDGTSTWRQTLTYSAGKVSAVSGWVKQ